MNRALESRLARLEGARGDPREAMTDAELEARIEELAKHLGGFEAIMASLDDSCAEDRHCRELLREHIEHQSRRSA